MKCFIAKYSWDGSWGAFQEYNLVIFAETKQVALGMALTEHKETFPYDWELTEISTEISSTNFISSRSS